MNHELLLPVKLDDLIVQSKICKIFEEVKLPEKIILEKAVSQKIVEKLQENVNNGFVGAFIEHNQSEIRTAKNITVHVDSIFNESVKGLIHEPVNYKMITGDEYSILEDCYSQKNIWSKKERHNLA